MSKESYKYSKHSANYIDNIHKWLKKKYGNANKCESKKCRRISNKFEWALKKGFDYEKNKNNFKMLCKSCHVFYDFNKRWRINLKKSRMMSKLNGFVPWNKGKKIGKQSKDHRNNLGLSQKKRWAMLDSKKRKKINKNISLALKNYYSARLFANK